MKFLIFRRINNEYSLPNQRKQFMMKILHKNNLKQEVPLSEKYFPMRVTSQSPMNAARCFSPIIPIKTKF